MRTVSTKVYDYKELSNEAKKTALKELEDMIEEYPWEGEVENVLDKFAIEFDLDIKSCSYDTHRGEVKWESNELNIEYIEGAGLRKYLNDRHIWCIRNYKECSLTGYYLDFDILKPMADYLNNPNAYTTHEDLIDACMKSLIDAVVYDYNHMFSDEALIEASHEFEFYEDGTVFEG